MDNTDDNYMERCCDYVWATIEWSSYNGRIDEVLYKLLELHSNGGAHGVSETAKYIWGETSPIHEDYVEIIKYALCYENPWLMDYGVSPRSAWMTSRGREWWADIKSKVSAEKSKGTVG